MAGENQTPSTPPEGASPDGGSGGDDKPPKWFSDFAAKVDGRFGELGKDMAKFREKLKPAAPKTESEPKPNGASPSAPSVTPDDLSAAMRLGEARARLPNDDARAHIDSLIEGGSSFRDALSHAESILKFSSQPANGSNGSNGAASAPSRGHGAIPANNNRPRHPSTQAEALELKSSNPDQFQRLTEDPDFDFYRLPVR